MCTKSTLLDSINRINVDDLYLVEKDLQFYEKASLALLLFGHERLTAEFVLQKLLVSSQAPNADTDILSCYTKVNPTNWKLFLVEALSIIKANRILRNLGFNIDEVKIHFLPHHPRMALHINPVLKALYAMCEMLTPADAVHLIKDLSKETGEPLRFYDYECLEVFLLDWITKRVLETSATQTTNLDVLINYFKLNEKCDIKATLELSFAPAVADSSVQSPSKETVNKLDNCVEPIVFERKSAPIEAVPSDCYNIRRETAGIFLVINQRDFTRSKNPQLQHLLPERELFKREGTDRDRDVLVETFASFGYKTIPVDNLDHIQMLGKIRDVVKRSVIYDSLIIAILTHGQDGILYACDSVPISIKKIEEILTDRDLASKPKMLIIQACQGNVIQRGIDCDELQTDGNENAVAYGDMIKAMSTVSGFASFRSARSGSWFIQTLSKKINELGDKEHILEIMTVVIDEVCSKRGLDNVCMTPITSQTLRKKFRLPKRFSVPLSR